MQIIGGTCLDDYFLVALDDRLPGLLALSYLGTMVNRPVGFIFSGNLNGAALSLRTEYVLVLLYIEFHAFVPFIRVEGI